VKNNYLCSMRCPLCGSRLMVAENIYGWYVICENECNVDDGILIFSSRRLAIKNFRLNGSNVMRDDMSNLTVVGFTQCSMAVRVSTTY